MTVKGSELQNPERGMEQRHPEQGQAALEQREQQKRRELEEAAAAEAEAKRQQAEERKALRARVDAARALEPEPGELHWRERWRQGRDEAVGAFEATEGTLRERVIAGRSLVPVASDGCRDCYEKGRDAALRIIEGARPR